VCNRTNKIVFIILASTAIAMLVFLSIVEMTRIATMIWREKIKPPPDDRAIEAARKVLGDINLDPASSSPPRPIPGNAPSENAPPGLRGAASPM
jgi:hypothetical protein